MPTYLFSICLCLICLVACKPKNETEIRVPANVLSEEQMITLLTDCYLAEAASGINVLNIPGTKFDSAYVFNPFKDNNIKKAEFDSSFTFYSRHPKALKAIYDKVLEKLSKIQAAKSVK